MVVLVLTDCPPKVRGDLSKWLFEINTGVYVGNISARVRELLWNRICENIRQGQATMVYSAAGEQHMEFCVHNTSWQITDFDGIKLMKRPLPNVRQQESNNIYCESGFSKAAKYQKGKKIQLSKQKKISGMGNYIVIDIETTGLTHLSDDIIEIAAIKIVNGKADEEFHTLVQNEKAIPESIIELTGITQEEIKQNGINLYTALQEFLTFIKDETIVCHNIAFDYRFIQAACKKVQLQSPKNECIDTLALARRKLKGLSDYQLKTIADYFSIDVTGMHRALRDCYITYGIYNKLNEM